LSPIKLSKPSNISEKRHTMTTLILNHDLHLPKREYMLILQPFISLSLSHTHAHTHTVQPNHLLTIPY
jgi:hypothetical protein